MHGFTYQEISMGETTNGQSDQMSRPALESEIFCLKAVIVAYDQATIRALRQNISLSSSGPERKLYRKKQQ